MISNVKNYERFIELFPGHWMNADKPEQEISIKIYELLAKRINPTDKMLAAQLSYSEDEIREILAPLSVGIYREEDKIVGFAGLTTYEMGHTLTIDQFTTYAWCALDILFIPGILGKKVDIKSLDPITKNELELTVDNKDIVSKQPLFVSLIIPDEEKLNENIINNFCHFIYFFESESSGMTWTQKNPDTYLVPISEAMELAQLMNRTRYNHFIN